MTVGPVVSWGIYNVLHFLLLPPHRKSYILPPSRTHEDQFCGSTRQSTSDNRHTAITMRVTLLLWSLTNAAILARVQTVRREAEDLWGLTKASVPQYLHRYCDQSDQYTIFSEGLPNTY